MPIKIQISPPDSEILTQELHKSPITIGRSSECDVPVLDVKLSRKHLSMFVQDGVAYFKDLGAKNGVWRDGKRVGLAGLKLGQELKIGHTIITLCEESMSEDEKSKHQDFDKKKMLEEMQPITHATEDGGPSVALKELRKEDVSKFHEDRVESPKKKSLIGKMLGWLWPFGKKSVDQDDEEDEIEESEEK